MAAEHFTSDIHNARTRFLSNCEAAGLAVASFRPPLVEDNEAKFADIVRIGSPNADRLLIIAPGMRLADALCASGIEIGLLRESLREELPREVAIVMVHAIEPAVFTVHSTAHDLPKNRDWDDSVLAAAENRFAEYARKEGLELDLAEAGEEIPNVPPGWPLETAAAIAERFLAGARRAIMIDVHTGSGAYGEGEAISCHAPGTPGERRAAEVFGARVAIDAAAAGAIAGPVARVLAGRLGTAEVTALVLEFGAYSIRAVIDSMLSRGSGDPGDGPGIGRLFYPDTDDWKELVWTRAVEVVRAGLKALAAD
ncbi:MAG: DUF2817 domain-containing protein [Rhodospirillales bacterium]|jgi:hypothetical protein|nr:DUF2817 domain-containing protein [Rhodospirillales bacterium]